MVVYTSLTIGGTTYTDQTSMKVKISISENNALSTATITFPNFQGRHDDDFFVGQEVRIRADKDTNPATTTIFLGLVRDVNFSGYANHSIVTIEAKDYSTRLQDITVPPTVYSDSEISTIVENLIDLYVSDITTTNVAVTSRTLSRLTIKHNSVYDAIKQLAEMVGYIFYVDTSKDLNFKLKDATSSGVTLNSSNVVKAKFRTNGDEMANEVWIYGGKTYRGWQDVFTQDGTGSKFTLTYKPHDTEVIVRTGGGASVKKGGVFQMVTIPTAEQQYLIDYDNKLLIFTSGTEAGNNIPGSPGSIVVNYQKAVPIVRIGENETSIGSYGRISKVIIDNQIDQPLAADDILRSQLDLYSDPIPEGTITLQGTVTLVPGTTVVVNLPHFNVNNQVYTVNEVSYDFNAQSVLTNETTTVKVARHISNITDTLKEVIMEIKRLRAQQIDTSDVLTRVKFATGSFLLQVSGWGLYTRSMGSSFVLGHPTLGKLGPGLSPQPRLGDSRGAATILLSGTGQ